MSSSQSVDLDMEDLSGRKHLASVRVVGKFIGAWLLREDNQAIDLSAFITFIEPHPLLIRTG